MTIDSKSASKQTPGVDPDWSLWPDSYGWWLELRERIGIEEFREDVSSTA